MDALLIVSLFSKFLLSLPSVIRLVYVCFVKAALGAAFGGVFTAFLAVFESFSWFFEMAWRAASWPVFQLRAGLCDRRGFWTDLCDRRCLD